MGTDLPVHDLRKALAITGGLADVADDMLRALLADLPGQLAAARKALEAGEWAGLRALVHQLKGGTSVCAVPALHEAVCQLQAAARATDALQARERLTAVEAEHLRLAATLRHRMSR